MAPTKRTSSASAPANASAPKKLKRNNSSSLAQVRESVAAWVFFPLESLFPTLTFYLLRSRYSLPSPSRPRSQLPLVRAKRPKLSPEPSSNLLQPRSTNPPRSRTGRSSPFRRSMTLPPLRKSKMRRPSLSSPSRTSLRS
jgi:hypothetical protein